MLDSLTGRERRVLQLRFGLEDGRARTLEEVGKEFNVTRERIRQIEAKALRKLRHPSRSPQAQGLPGVARASGAGGGDPGSGAGRRIGPIGDPPATLVASAADRPGPHRTAPRKEPLGEGPFSVLARAVPAWPASVSSSAQLNLCIAAE